MDRIQDVTERAVADAKARFDALAREASHRAERDRELAAKVQAITATAASRRDEVNVTVNHAGQVTDVTISEKGMELSAQDLSRLVVETIRKAGAQVGQLVGGAVRESWGDNSPEGTRTLSAYDVFGAPPQDIESSPGSSTGNARMPWNIGGNRS